MSQNFRNIVAFILDFMEKDDLLPSIFPSYVRNEITHYAHFIASLTFLATELTPDNDTTLREIQRKLESTKALLLPPGVIEAKATKLIDGQVD